jgi:hypothetical protein
MRKRILLLALTVTVLTILTVNGQQLYKCNTTKSFWTFTKDSSFFAVKLLGNAKETERKSVISVDNYVLQNLLIDKAKFMKEGEDNSDLKVLVRYAMSEAEYFSGVFKTKINIQMQKAPLSADKSVLIWFFEMPSGKNEKVKFQLFANIIIGDKIFGFASSQFADQKFDSVKDFLMDVISTLKRVDNKNDFDKLCGQ